MSKASIEDYEDGILKYKEQIEESQRLIFILEEKLKEMLGMKQNSTIWEAYQNPYWMVEWNKSQNYWRRFDIQKAINMQKRDITSKERMIANIERTIVKIKVKEQKRQTKLLAKEEKRRAKEEAKNLKG